MLIYKVSSQQMMCSRGWIWKVCELQSQYHLKHTVTSLEHTVTSLEHTVTSLEHMVTSLEHTVTSLEHTVTSLERTVNLPKHTLHSPKKHTVKSPKPDLLNVVIHWYIQYRLKVHYI